ncbi:MAG: hypothetical protein EPO07_06240 [Verrucomicrobia bacterium]|nr:MAG: hypothetical protein EPO07_06240 [Verrucomicrobiota bacterium]
MRLSREENRGLIRARAYTLAEVLVSVLVVGLVGVSFYVAMSVGFRLVGSARENLRAAHLLIQCTENLRLYSWSQLPSITNSFIAVYDPYAATNKSGAKFYGTVTRSTPTALPAAYQNKMLMFDVAVRWTNYNGTTPIPQYRHMQTYVSKYGMQNYVYGQ